jgi:hypothetical protein
VGTQVGSSVRDHACEASSSTTDCNRHQQASHCSLTSSPKTRTLILKRSTKAPATAISAKFELDDHQQLSLSVYTAEQGLNVDAEHNVLKELAGSPAGEAWRPEAEVFEDAEHLKRAAAQLTLMALSPHMLLDIIAKAEKDQPGTVFSITPVVESHTPQCVVLVAAQGKVVTMRYNLMTGESMKKV